MPPTQRSSSDVFWMRRALALARKMRGHVWPNPPVGCVIVKNDTAIADAATHAGGRPHAEHAALEQAGTAAKGATLYATLEPCCHWGRTPPCSDAILEAEISRVVRAIRDPDPRVNGGGIARLTEAGVAVSVGLCADEAERIMSGFFHRVRHGIPELIVLSQASACVPPGLDALVVSSPRGTRLLTHEGEIDVSETEPHRLLNRMGEIGLTSVGVSSWDRLFGALASSSASTEGSLRCG